MPRTQALDQARDVIRRHRGHESGEGHGAQSKAQAPQPAASSKGDENGNDGGGAGGPVKSSHIIEEHLDLGVPRQVAFDQWVHYQDLARYSKRESAQSKAQDRVSFQSKIGPSTRSWEAEVVDQVPGRRIAWRSIGGAKTTGVVTFHSLGGDDRLTRVMVEMEYHPTGAIETVGNFFRMQRRRVRKDLKLFKHFVELRGEAIGQSGDETPRDQPHAQSAAPAADAIKQGGRRAHDNAGQTRKANTADGRGRSRARVAARAERGGTS